MEAEGAESSHVVDTNKIRCPYCGGVEIMLSNLMDNPNDITLDPDFAALLITNAGGKDIQGLVGLCVQCGHEWVPFWYLFDVAVADSGNLTMTDLVTAITANLLEGLYMIPFTGSDTEKYFIIDTNTAADPAVIVPTVAPNDDSDGIWMITNILPVGYTAAS